jgi:predicted site-specific integrase-resolvase
MTTQLLNSADAAAVLMLTPAQVRTLVRKGQLPHVALPNGEIRFDPDDIRQWVESHKQPATAEGGTP